MNKELSKVSVVTITYGHEKYITETLDGVLMQQYDGPVEFIIANDNSPDATDEVVKKYFLENPVPSNFEIKYTKHETNKGMMPNFIWALEQATGKYIALCEGDDYWTDPLKLQKQVDFLENNLEFGITHADCDFKYIKDKKVVKSINKKGGFDPNYKLDKNILFDRLIDGSYKLRTATVLIRAACFDKIKMRYWQLFKKEKFLMGDTPLWLFLSQITHFHYFDEVFSIYNLSANSASRPSEYRKVLRFRLSMAELRMWFLNEFDKPISNELRKRYNQSLLYYKLYDWEYNEMFAVINLESKEKLLWRLMKTDLFREILKFMNKLNYIKIIFHLFLNNLRLKFSSNK